jgi:hypothetical protein
MVRPALLNGQRHRHPLEPAYGPPIATSPAPRRASWQSGNLPVLCLGPMRPQASLCIWKFVERRQSQRAPWPPASGLNFTEAGPRLGIRSSCAIEPGGRMQMHERRRRHRNPNSHLLFHGRNSTKFGKKKPLQSFHTTTKAQFHRLGMGP